MKELIRFYASEYSDYDRAIVEGSYYRKTWKRLHGDADDVSVIGTDKPKHRFHAVPPERELY